MSSSWKACWLSAGWAPGSAYYNICSKNFGAAVGCKTG
jgi:hypothetical protein